MRRSQRAVGAGPLGGTCRPGFQAAVDPLAGRPVALGDPGIRHATRGILRTALRRMPPHQTLLGNVLAIAHAAPVVRVMLPAASAIVAGDFAPRAEMAMLVVVHVAMNVPVMNMARVTMVVVMKVVMDHYVPTRPVKGAEVERRRDPVAHAPVNAEAGIDHCRTVPVYRRVSRPPPRSVNDCGIVERHVDDPGAGRLDVDVLLLADDPNMLIALQAAVRIGALAKILDRFDDLLLLPQKGISQALGPLQVLVHARQQLGEGDQRHDTWIPVLVRHRGYRLLAAQAGMGA